MPSRKSPRSPGAPEGGETHSLSRWCLGPLGESGWWAPVGLGGSCVGLGAGQGPPGPRAEVHFSPGRGRVGAARQGAKSGLHVALPPGRIMRDSLSAPQSAARGRGAGRSPGGAPPPPPPGAAPEPRGRQGLTCVGRSSARSSSPSPSLATIALPMSAPSASVRGASHWMWGQWRTAGSGRAQARWGARPTGGTLYTGTATIAVTWRRPPTRAPLLRRHRPPRAPAGRLPAPSPAVLPGAPSLRRRPGDPGAAGPRQVGGRAPPAAGMLLCVSPSRLRAGWHRRPATPTQDPGRTREPHTPLPGPGPSFLCFPGPAILPHPTPPKEKSEAPARRAAFSPGSNRARGPGAGGLSRPGVSQVPAPEDGGRGGGLSGYPGCSAGLAGGARARSNVCARPRAHRARPATRFVF